jgi:hypothetical protein
MKRTILSATTAFAVVLTWTFGCSGPASAEPIGNHSKKEAVALIQKADPGTRTTGRVHAAHGTVRAADLEVTIFGAGDATLVGDDSVMAGGGIDYVSRAVEGGFQIAAVIDGSSESTQTYKFAGKYLEINEAGYVIVRAGSMTGEPVAVVDPAWAVDADGAKVASRFSVNGDELTQTTSAGKATAFPVVADPRVRSAWYGLSVDFTKKETKAMSLAGNSCAALLGYASVIAAASGVGVTVSVIVGALTAGCATIGALSDAAYENGKCISLKIFTAIPGATAPWIATCYK